MTVTYLFPFDAPKYQIVLLATMIPKVGEKLNLGVAKFGLIPFVVKEVKETTIYVDIDIFGFQAMMESQQKPTYDINFQYEVFENNSSGEELLFSEVFGIPWQYCK